MFSTRSQALWAIFAIWFCRHECMIRGMSASRALFRFIADGCKPRAAIIPPH
jgi:hypothetical protein